MYTTRSQLKIWCSIIPTNLNECFLSVARNGACVCRVAFPAWMQISQNRLEHCPEYVNGGIKIRPWCANCRPTFSSVAGSAFFLPRFPDAGAGGVDGESSGSTRRPPSHHRDKWVRIDAGERQPVHVKILSRARSYRASLSPSRSVELQAWRRDTRQSCSSLHFASQARQCV